MLSLPVANEERKEEDEKEEEDALEDAKIDSFEMKLSAISRQLDRMKEKMSAAHENRKQFEQLLTDRGRELLQQPLRGKAGAFSEHVRVFATQLHFCSPGAYMQLRRF